MHIKDMDLNLLRLFDAVYCTRSVSRAAESLDITQPAASQGLTRLRLLLKDPLFVRAAGGVQPTPAALRLADAVRQALAILEKALAPASAFDPLASRHTFHIHMSDIGETRFLPTLMATLGRVAPGVRLETAPVPATEIAPALDSGRLDFAFGFLPGIRDTRSAVLIRDHYIVLLRDGHPQLPRLRRLRGDALIAQLQALEFVAVRSHSETLRILQMLRLEERLRLVTQHFLVLPGIVKATELAVVMPRSIALGFAAGGGYALVEPAFPLRDFEVSLHWSRRSQDDPAHRWMRETITQAFADHA